MGGLRSHLAQAQAQVGGWGHASGRRLGVRRSAAPSSEWTLWVGYSIGGLARVCPEQMNHRQTGGKPLVKCWRRLGAIRHRQTHVRFPAVHAIDQCCNTAGAAHLRSYVGVFPAPTCS